MIPALQIGNGLKWKNIKVHFAVAARSGLSYTFHVEWESLAAGWWHILPFFVSWLQMG